MVAGDGLLGLGAVGRHVSGLLVLLEVGYVEARPLALSAVPPDVALALGPRVPVRIGGGAVVDDSTVRRPGPRPLGRDVALLLPVRLLARGLVDPVLEAAAVDPAAAQRRAVVLQLGIAREELAARDLPAVDLLQHRLRIGLLHRRVRGVLPAQRLDQLVALVLRLGELLLDQPAEVEVEPELRATVLLRLDRLPVPLQQPLRVGERAVFLGVRGGREEEDLRRDLLGLQLARLDLRAVVPEGGGLDLHHVAHDQPLEA